MAREAGEEAVAGPAARRAPARLEDERERDRARPVGGARRRPGGSRTRSSSAAGCGLVEQLVAQAPRGVRPMLENLDRLLAVLTLGGLRRWALWGARAHATDFAAQERYFALASPDALAILQKERKGTLLVDVHRRLSMYLRALWGRDFWLRPAAGEREDARPFIADFTIHLPDALDDAPGRRRARPLPRHGRARRGPPRLHARGDVGRGAHAPAGGRHRRDRGRARGGPGRPRLSRPRDGLAPPAPRHALPATGGSAPSSTAWPGRWPIPPTRTRTRWSRRPGVVGPKAHCPASPTAYRGTRESRWRTISRVCGSPSTRARTGPPWPTATTTATSWEFDEADALAGARAVAGPPGAPPREPHGVRERGRRRGRGRRRAGDLDAPHRALPRRRRRPQLERARRPARRRADPVRYPEWDYRLQVDRPDWCTVLESRAPSGEAAAIDALVAANKPLAERLRRLIEALQPEGVQRLRRQEEGDDLDLEAAVRAAVDLRLGADARHARAPAHRCAASATSRSCSSSTCRSRPTTACARARPRCSTSRARPRRCSPTRWRSSATRSPSTASAPTAATRWTTAASRTSARPTAPASKARLAAMNGELSTRMGAAMRHAGRLLARRPERKRLLVVLTDGAPSDVDVRDPQYLRADARKAVEALGRERGRHLLREPRPGRRRLRLAHLRRRPLRRRGPRGAPARAPAGARAGAAALSVDISAMPYGNDKQE